MCTVIGVVVVLLTPAHYQWRVRAVAGWDAGVSVLLAMNWWLILRADPRTTARRAATEDVGRVLILLLTLAAAAFSLFSAVWVLKQADSFPVGPREVWSGFALLGVALAWTLTHTAYALHYAHMHYGSSHISGFEFPGNHPPADIDFAYLAFTVGMTFAVSDVEVTSPRTRRVVLFHALVSFVYNLTILALVIELLLSWLR